MARLTARSAEARHTLRLMVTCAAAFALYHLFSLPQGYWAVFTVVIVMQPSIGGTLGASRDRMIGTFAGAAIGAFAVMARPQTPEGLGAALTLAVGLTGFGAALRNDLKVAPVTAAIVLLSPAGPTGGPLEAALFRVAEIGLGGVIAVAATLLILPARSHAVVAVRAAAVLEQIAALLEHLAAQAAAELGSVAADGLERRLARHDDIRIALGGLESAMSDAEREQRSHLGEHRLPTALLRSLWRIRSDASTIGRALDVALPPALSARLGPAAAGILRAEAAFARHCSRAAARDVAVDRGDASSALAAFHDVMEALRRERLTRGLTFDDAGRAFAIGFALESLYRNLSDLPDRIAAAAARNVPGTAGGAARR